MIVMSYKGPFYHLDIKLQIGWTEIFSNCRRFMSIQITAALSMSIITVSIRSVKNGDYQFKHICYWICLT